ncbi:hypothetical protein WJX81_000542 [Elliptochloris bilobata]|uniref:Protein-serine/threonine phosphatase n=1 Tax=Elliptochloris bilobata TaxID=381761 RepID=A0AAW1SCV6_9CHLO
MDIKAFGAAGLGIVIGTYHAWRHLRRAPTTDTDEAWEDAEHFGPMLDCEHTSGATEHLEVPAERLEFGVPLPHPQQVLPSPFEAVLSGYDEMNSRCSHDRISSSCAATPYGTTRNGFGRNRSISTPERSRAHGVAIPLQGGSPVRRPGLPPTPSSEHNSELLLLRGAMLDSAPTEEGFFLSGQIDEALASLHSEETGLTAARRYSRSFSEPNLTLKVLQESIAAREDAERVAAQQAMEEEAAAAAEAAATTEAEAAAAAAAEAESDANASSGFTGLSSGFDLSRSNEASWASEQATALAWPGLRGGSGFFGSAFESPPLSEEWAATGGAALSGAGSGPVMGPPLGNGGNPLSRSSSGLMRAGSGLGRMGSAGIARTASGLSPCAEDGVCVALGGSEKMPSPPPPPPLLRLVVSAGPSAARELSSDEKMTQILVGRLPTSTMAINDGEVSGRHAMLQWETAERCWQVRDLGSLNGTSLNGRIISTSNRRPGRPWRLNDGDELLLGAHSVVRVEYLPRPGVELSSLAVAPKVKVPSTAAPLRATATLMSEHLHALADADAAAAAAAAAPLEVPALRLAACAAARVGREHARLGQGNEDVTLAEADLMGVGAPAALFCVFDGHCGRRAAEQAAQALPRELAARLPEEGPGLAAGRGAGRAWEAAFQAIDAALTVEEGCTATALLAWRDAAGAVCLQAANVGDSAAFFAPFPKRRSAPPEVVPLTADHRVANPDERQRLEGMGIKLGTRSTRLYGLNLSRCLGDKFLKDGDLGLSAAPHVSRVVRLPPRASGLVVLASDGLWDVADAARAVAVAWAAYADSGNSAAAAAGELVAHAQRQRTKDDVSVVVVVVRADAHPNHGVAVNGAERSSSGGSTSSEAVLMDCAPAASL